jgi:soluble lytic murein transglycosylase
MQVSVSTARRLGIRVLWAFFMSVIAVTPASATHDGEGEVHVASVPPGSDAIGHEINLPRVLSEADVARYHQIFALQEDGDLKAAARLIEQLENTILLGHVQAQKYLHPTAHRSSYMELKLWLDDYADHPQARRIYRLAMRRKPADYKSPHKPIPAMRATVTEEDEVESDDYVSPRKRTRAQRRNLINLLTHIRKHIRRNELTHAREHMDGPKLNRIADEVEIDIVRAEIAYAFFIWGRDDDALAMAEQSVQRSGGLAPLGYWTAGLVAYRRGDLESARRHFEGLATASRGADALIAGGAYWAARLNLITRRPERVDRHLQIAANYSRTFYGLLANRALGQDVTFAWEPPPLTDRDVDVVLRIRPFRGWPDRLRRNGDAPPPPRNQPGPGQSHACPGDAHRPAGEPVAGRYRPERNGRAPS